MPRNLKAEQNALANVEKLKGAWHKFHEAINARGGKTSSLLARVHETGYMISESQLRDQIRKVKEGAGIIQNPVLLPIICEIIDYKIENVFVPSPLYRSNIIKRETGLTSDSLRSIVLAALHEFEKQKIKVPKAPSEGVRRNWPEKLQKILGELMEISKPIYNNLWAFPQDDLKRLAVNCVKAFPGSKIFNIIGWDRVLANYSEILMRGVKNSRLYLFICLSLTATGFFQSYYAFTKLSKTKPRRGLEFEVKSFSKEILINMNETMKDFLNQIARLNNYVVRWITGPYFYFSDEMRLSWWNFANLNWMIIALWQNMLLNTQTYFKCRDINAEGELKRFIRSFIQSQGSAMSITTLHQEIWITENTVNEVRNVINYINMLIDPEDPTNKLVVDLKKIGFDL